MVPASVRYNELTRSRTHNDPGQSPPMLPGRLAVYSLHRGTFIRGTR